MKFQRSLQDEVSIDLTSLIDVVFLLLIFFMVTTTFTRDSNLLVNLPEAGGQPVAEAPLRIEVLIARNGSYSVNGQALADTQLASLMAAIEEIAGGDNSLPVTITADADTTHQSVVTAMDAMARLGFGRLSIATRQATEAEAGEPGSTP
jgi:biopolymer transport protein ExbD